MGEVGSVVYVTGCRRSKRIVAAELTEGDLFVTEDDLHEVLVVTEVAFPHSSPDDEYDKWVNIHYLSVTGDDKGKTDVWATNLESFVWLVEFVQAPVY